MPSEPTAVHVWLVLFKTARAVARVAAAAFQEPELGQSDFHVLELLLHKGAMPVNAIGPRVNLTPGSISVAVDRLHARGLVSRVEDPNDRRSRIVDLTPAGRTLIVPVFERHAATIAQIMSVLSPDERAQLASLLKKVGHHADALHAEAVPATGADPSASGRSNASRAPRAARHAEPV